MLKFYFPTYVMVGPEGMVGHRKQTGNLMEVDKFYVSYLPGARKRGRGRGGGVGDRAGGEEGEGEENSSQKFLLNPG